MTNTSGGSRPEELKQKQQQPPSSSSVPGELLGFTPASELYSVGIFHLRVFLFSSLLVMEFCSFQCLYLWFLQMKRKRVGAGQRGSSDPFQAAKELLKPAPTCGPGSGETNSVVAPPPVSCSIRARAKATAASASVTSPSKAGRGVGRKQQKLAEAAKTSRSISHYFTKKETTENLEEGGLDPADLHTSHGAEARDQPSPPPVEEAMETSPSWSESGDVGTEGSKAEVMIISDSESEEETTVEPESTAE